VPAVPTASVNGIDVYYERSGSGPPLLFCNGSGQSLATSGFLVQLFAPHFAVLAHDQRGLGQTSVPPGPYSMADYATDIAALLDHVGWATCRVVGISFGGMVAQEFAVTHPERVERLALLCTSPGGEGGASYPLHELESLPADQRADIALRILDSRFDAEWLASHPSDRGLVEMMAQRNLVEKSDEQRRGEREQLLARAGHDVCDRLQRVTCPTLVAAGRYDGIAPLANAEAIVARVPNAELRVYEGGHAFFAQDAAAFPDVIAFLAR
jgi:pimeloyl-ACP methyl ester carboxylesterase